MSQSLKHWYDTLFTYVWVFNTGRGLSIMVRLPNNFGILYDLGCSEEFSPSDFIARHIAPHLTKYKSNKEDKNPTSLAQCVLSHPHADHIWEIDAILDKDGKKTTLYPSLLTCPNDKDGQDENQKVDLKRIKRDDNAELIEKYRAAYKSRSLPLQTIQCQEGRVPNVEYGVYFLRPGSVSEEHPKNDQDYTNGLSILFYLRHGKQTILVSGDVTPEVLARILDDGDGVEKRYTYFWDVPEGTPTDLHQTTSSQPSLRELLEERGLSILVTPHHGLESCFSNDLFDAIKDNHTQLNVISEERHEGEASGTVDSRYQSSATATGLKADVDGEMTDCCSVSTRNGHHILLIFKGTDATPHVFLRKEPKDLLEIA